MSDVDLLVLGGGINGLGIAADAASRGLSVLLAERKDLGSGTTSASSRLIHGGLRYLQYGEIDLVRESLRERGILARQRPHLVLPIVLAIPTYAGQPTPRWRIGVGLAAYEMLARDTLFPRPSLLSADALRQREPGLNPAGLTGGFLYPDAQIPYPERLCVELAQETIAGGGDVQTYTRAVRLLQENGRVAGALLRDEWTGEERMVRAALTVNAAGPWVDAINRTLGVATPRLIGGTWGTHLVLPRRGAGPRGPLYAAARRDGRPFFLLPWDNRLLVGTTDVRFEGIDPDTAAKEDWEIEYLLEETGQLFPDAGYSRADIEATTFGIRPLPRSEKATGAVTRRHFLVDHGARHGLPGLASIVGGKLTTYRSLAQEAVDWALRTLGRPAVACSTAVTDGRLAPEALQADLVRNGLEPARAARLFALYGDAARDLQARIARDPSLAAPLFAGSDDCEAQVVHAVRAEKARTADDIVRRRLMHLPASEIALDAVRKAAAARGLRLDG